MIFAAPLQHYLILDKAEKIHSSLTNRTFTYDRGNKGGSTTSLRRFLRLLQLSNYVWIICWLPISHLLMKVNAKDFLEYRK